MQPYVSTHADAYRFSIGFPKEIVDDMPLDEIEAWIAERPEKRAVAVARLTNMDLSSDETLASRLLGAYGNNEQVASECFSQYVSGMWRGSATSHWTQLAEALDDVVGRAALPTVRRWASDSARSLRRMAERDRQWEEEEDLRRR